MSVTADSTTWGLAPGRTVLTETIDAEEHQSQTEHAGQDRSTDGEVRDFHESVRLGGLGWKF
jgi:hypothetical protein